METSVAADGATEAETEKVETSNQPAGDASETAVTPTTMAIEIVLPTIIATHVKNILMRRGIALDDFVLDLLSRFVPGAVEMALHTSEPDIAEALCIRGETKR